MELSLLTPTKAMVGYFSLILLFLYAFLKLSRSFRTHGKRPPPVAGGVLPVLGHLHLLSGPAPAHKILANMADKHGPIFTLKLGVHKTLVVSNWEIAKECFTTNDKTFANRPKLLSFDLLGYNYAVLGLSPYGPYWRHVRKILILQALSNARIDLLKHTREAEIRTSIKELHELTAYGSDVAMVEMKRWFAEVSLNMIFRLVVGKRFTSAFEEEASEEFRKALRAFFELTGAFVLSDAFPILKWLDIGGYQKVMKKTAKAMDKVFDIWLEEHKQKRILGEVKDNELDFTDIILSILDGAQEVEGRDADTTIKASSLTLILGGSDTIMVTMTWALSLLLNNREVLKKAQQELGRKIGKERQVNESDLKDLIYLQAIIKEAMRLYPAGPLSIPHESMEDCTVASYHVPAGTRLFVNLSVIHRDPNVWEYPNEFRPERFLTTHKDIDVRGNNHELMPFGSGRRVCPGIPFALQVMKLTLANLLHGFEIVTLSDEPVDMTECSGLTNLKKTPLDVILTPRLPVHLYG